MLRIRTKHLIFYILLFFICIPGNSNFPAAFSIIRLAFTYIGFGVAMVLFFHFKYYRRKMLLPLIVWFIWIFVATLLNGTDVVGTITDIIIPFLSSAILAVYLFDNDRENVVSVITWMLTLFMVVQLFSLLTHCFGTRFTQGRYSSIFFLGIRVNINKLFPFALFFGLINYRFGKRRSPLCLIITTVCGLWFVIAQKVSTSVIGFAIIVIILIASRLIRSEHAWRNMAILAVCVGALFAFVYTGAGGFSEWVFSDTLGEDITLSGRTRIWAQAIADMKGIHWLIGNGYGHKFLFSLNVFATNLTHNQYLGVIFNYGLIGLGVNVWCYVRQFKAMKAAGNRIASRIFIAVFIALVFMQIPAAVNDWCFYYVFYIATLYLPEIVAVEAAETSRRRLIVRWLPQKKGI